MHFTLALFSVRRKIALTITVASQIIFGGAGNASLLNDLWTFDTRTQQWQSHAPAGPIPRAREMHAGITVGPSMYLVFGGRALAQQVGVQHSTSQPPAPSTWQCRCRPDDQRALLAPRNRCWPACCNLPCAFEAVWARNRCSGFE